jgi:hypothetical protein
LKNKGSNLFRAGRRQNLFNMFNRKKTNRRAVWTSLLGLGIGAAALSFRKNGARNMTAPIQRLTNNVRFQAPGQMASITNAIMEFSKELAPHKKHSTNK